MRRRRYLSAIGGTVGAAGLSGCLGVFGASQPLVVSETETSYTSAGIFQLDVTVENTTNSTKKGTVVGEIQFTQLDRTESERRQLFVEGGETKSATLTFLLTRAVAGEPYETSAEVVEIENLSDSETRLTVSGRVAPVDSAAGWPAPHYSNRNTNFNPETEGPRGDPSVVWESDDISSSSTTAPIVGTDAMYVGPGVTAISLDTKERQ